MTGASGKEARKWLISVTDRLWLLRTSLVFTGLGFYLCPGCSMFEYLVAAAHSSDTTTPSGMFNVLTCNTMLSFTKFTLRTGKPSLKKKKKLEKVSCFK